MKHLWNMVIGKGIVLLYTYNRRYNDNAFVVYWAQYAWSKFEYRSRCYVVISMSMWLESDRYWRRHSFFVYHICWEVDRRKIEVDGCELNHGINHSVPWNSFLRFFIFHLLFFLFFTILFSTYSNCNLVNFRVRCVSSESEKWTEHQNLIFFYFLWVLIL